MWNPTYLNRNNKDYPRTSLIYKTKKLSLLPLDRWILFGWRYNLLYGVDSSIPYLSLLEKHKLYAFIDIFMRKVLSLRNRSDVFGGWEGGRRLSPKYVWVRFEYLRVLCDLPMNMFHFYRGYTIWSSFIDFFVNSLQLKVYVNEKDTII